MTFNNPEFLKQCKTRGVNVEELNTGWVKQYPLDHVPEDLEEEDEDKDLEEISEDVPVSEKVDKSEDEEDEDDWDDWDEEEEEEEEKEPSEPQEMTKEEVSDMLNESEESSMGLDAPPSADFLDKLVSGTPNRDKVAAALDKIDSPTKPKIKLNLDPGKAKNIKLNLKPKE